MSEAIVTTPEQVLEKKTNLGFWTYLMTDCMLFATLFVAFVVLRGGVAGGPSGHDIFDMPIVLVETIILLVSSFTCGMAILAMKYGNKKLLITGLAATYILGISFLTIELNEFSNLVHAGHGWGQSAFLSAFFTLVGTHGLHIFIGLLWLLVMACVVIVRGVSAKAKRQLVLFSLYWHFLDLVWIFIFTVVYLMGVV